jgi:three-Cys-motif partner protein
MAKDNKDFFIKKNNWSEVKDRLLKCYLTPYFQKILKNRRPIYYVDCFAGKGKFEDGKPGSPIIALSARDQCLENTTLYGVKGQIETCFIELNHAEELAKNIDIYRSKNGHPVVISGKFEDNIEDLLNKKKGANIFLYIDPYGIKALDSELFRKFDAYKFHSLEILINFNSFGFFRDACRVLGVNELNDDAFLCLDELVEYDPTNISASQQPEALLTKIAGGDYWKSIVLKYKNKKINGYTAEKIFSQEYKKTLQKRYSYVLDMPIRLKPGQHPKYRMFHISNHQDGCYLMAQNMLRRKNELFINIQQGGQLSFLNCFNNLHVNHENKAVSTNEISAMLKKKILSFNNEFSLTKLLAEFMNEYGIVCDFKVVQLLLDDFKEKGIIDIVRNPAFTKTEKPTVFWEERKNKKITIRIK